MKSKLLLHLLIITALSVSFLGCTASLSKNQLRFGIQAAQAELWDEAIFRWKKVLETDPGSVAAFNNLAVAYEKKGLFDEAQRAYENALKIAPNNRYVKSNFDKFKRRQDSLDEDKKDEKK